jgi:triphosphoribosyl-dephospho-CoA synthase
MQLPLGLWAQTACIWEATARKAGNVHPGRDFDDLRYVDFLLSAAAIAPVFERVRERRVGELIFAGVEATRCVCRTNANLGILLLLVPLAAVPAGEDLRGGVEGVLSGLDVADAAAVYRAIRLARPGGLGEVAEQDIRAEPTLPLREIMHFAVDRDLIALQYVNGFHEVLDEGVPALARGLKTYANLEAAIVGAHLELLARHADSLIARKRGLAEAAEASRRAARVWQAGWPGRAGLEEFAGFDDWLRADGHARNPGTTADLIAASLFAALREGIITLPPTVPWSCESA